MKRIDPPHDVRVRRQPRILCAIARRAIDVNGCNREPLGRGPRRIQHVEPRVVVWAGTQRIGHEMRGIGPIKTGIGHGGAKQADLGRLINQRKRLSN